MTNILIAYGTTEGQTARIAEVVGEVLAAGGNAVTTKDAADTTGMALDGYDGVVIGSSVHMGRHDRHVIDLVRNNRDALAGIPSAFFSVSLAAHGDVAEAEGYVTEFERQTGWHPGAVALFSGALLYTRYGFIKRQMMKRIAGSKPGTLDTDTSRDYVYTEWDGVTRFAEHFAERLHSARA